MSTLWDHAVRALQPVFRETSDKRDEPLGYYCGGRGSESFCDHLTCRAVAALADADLLDYPGCQMPDVHGGGQTETPGNPPQPATKQELLREALAIWAEHGLALTDDTLPTYLIGHLAGHGWIILHDPLLEEAAGP